MQALKGFLQLAACPSGGLSKVLFSIPAPLLDFGASGIRSIQQRVARRIIIAGSLALLSRCTLVRPGGSQ